MTDDLVKRLRERNDLRMLTASMPPLPVKDWLCNAAADRIEQLEAALRKIACDGEPYDKCHCVNSNECSYGIARAALGEKKDG